MAKSNKSNTSENVEKLCVVTRDQFRKGAKPLTGKVGETPLAIVPKEFDTGTLGWFTNGKTIVEINGIPVNVSFMVQLFIPHSKDAK